MLVKKKNKTKSNGEKEDLQMMNWIHAGKQNNKQINQNMKLENNSFNVYRQYMTTT